MNIKILVSCAGIRFGFTKGENVEVDAEIGKDLIKAGYAEEIKSANTKKPKNTKDDADADT